MGLPKRRIFRVASKFFRACAVDFIFL